MYTAVLEPQPVIDRVPLLGGALNARNANDVRSPFSKPGAATASGRSRRCKRPGGGGLMLAGERRRERS